MSNAGISAHKHQSVLRRWLEKKTKQGKEEKAFQREDEEEIGTKKKGLSEIDHARRDCKARSVLNKFKKMEQRVMNGEEEEEGMY